jgi:hypothetical protein
MNPENKFKYLIVTITIIILVVGGYRYYQYMVERNFIIEVNTICDPQKEVCFSATDDMSYGQNPYKKVTLTARYASQCLEEHNCDSFSCPGVLEKSGICEITYCSDNTKDDGEECLGTQTNRN